MSYENLAIQVQTLSKRFEIYDHPRDQLKQLVFQRLRRMFGLSQKDYFREFWALRDVNLTIRRGESYGIVGLNGSGKSTLLQIITGTLTPTSGSVSTYGRIAALLELGAGFDGNFTGRENVYLNGSLLGLSNEQIAEKIDWIRSFADIGDHFDQPLITYSSGMQVRVAFAVATAFDPDILIIDEALAVGDAYFQQKCFHRIEQFKEKGGTLLFVSHDANTVKHLCDHAVLLSHGSVLRVGPPKDVIDLYQGLVARMTDLGERAVSVSQIVAQPAESFKENGRIWTKATTITTNQDAELVDFKLLDASGNEVLYMESESDLTVQYRVRLNKDFERPAFGLIVRDRLGRSLFETSTYAMRLEVPPVAKGKEVLVRFSMNFNLRAGSYSFSIGVANRGFSRSEFEEYSLLMHDVEQIELLEANQSAFYGGVFNMKPNVSIAVME
ncbi:ABC transporter ATP-binding protein [Rhizobium leucaenae]|uniref:Lipopolysaccharide transport system ATP-binding protein n=1 Tax=Rhizobium leucaenae TaxID=29450 RepID=A0A7W6ZZW9_9HYPH|nr:ABC transporter ATP-binding protein [Rhizobium leucaenae]MBB4571684.1 lipopolysaccharide transport system ATP-binding protein [Rhizobium leucaenae]